MEVLPQYIVVRCRTERTKLLGEDGPDRASRVGERSWPLAAGRGETWTGEGPSCDLWVAGSEPSEGGSGPASAMRPSGTGRWGDVGVAAVVVVVVNQPVIA